MRFPDHLLRLIRDRTSIAAYAQGKLAFDQRRSNPARGDYWACCPFHGEKTPSFHLLDQKGYYKCFGCGEAGDVFTLAQKLEGVSFPEAVERFAALAGVSLPERERLDPQAEDRRRRLYDVMARARALFQAALAGPEGAAALAYLESRGLGPELQRRFGLGFAPSERNWLTNRLVAEGFTRDEILEVGLAKRDERGEMKDFFWGRAMFPIEDAQGRPIAFGGRVIVKAEPKYLNSPETPLFSKGRTLYRLKQARELAARAKRPGLVVAEGYLDVIALETAGVGAVAPLGTALTEEQLEMVWRAGGEPTLCFDGDAAGRRAGERALDLALPHLSPQRTVRFAYLPPGKDPFDLWREGGAEALEQALAVSVGAAEALFERERAARALDTPEARAGLKERLRAAAGRIGHAETRNEYMRDLSSRAYALFRPERSAPAWSPAGGRRRPAPTPSASPEVKAQKDRRSAERIESLLRAAIDQPRLLDRGCEILSQLSIPDPELEAVRSAILALNADGATVDRSAVSNHLVASGDAGAAARILRWRRPMFNAIAAPSDEQAEANWMALATEFLANPALKADLAALRSRDPVELDDEAFARACATARARVAVEAETRVLKEKAQNDQAS